VKVLVTGSNGFLGATLVRRLCERGWPGSIRCLHRPASDLRRLEAARAAHPEASLELVAGNLVAPEDCARAIEGVDLVFHGAAALSGPAAELFLNTVVATRNLLDAVAAAGRPIRVILVSSFGVYGMAGEREGAVVSEETPLEPHPELRDLYSHSKLRQEQLAREYAEKRGVALTVLRPGVIYGPAGPAMSNRVGLRIAGLFLHLGRRNRLPLTYVDNCADALIAAARAEGAVGETYNVVDDDVPTAREYLRRYRREVEPLRVVSLPLWATRLMGRAVAWYHRWSRGQLPAILTPYKVDAAWRSFRYGNGKLKSIGWRPEVSTEEGLRRTFAALAAARH
jgi:nucleoside-diphosphate-sugar epimerase